MEKNVKGKMIMISLFGLLFGRILNRVLPNYFGDDSSNIIIVVILVFFVCLILISVVMKHYLTAIWISVMSFPIVVGGIGLFTDNMDMVGMSLLLLATVAGLSAIIIPKFANKNK